MKDCCALSQEYTLQLKVDGNRIPNNPPALRVLIVDDVEDFADTMALLLQLAGYSTRVAYNAERALEVAREQRPEVVLLDLALPRMDGYHVAEHLRLQEETRSAMLIAVTGYALPTHSASSRDCFDLHLLKPIDIEELRTVLATCAAARSYLSNDGASAIC